MKKNILFVDDDQRLRELLKDFLEEKKFNVYLCEDFLEAKEILSFIFFDLVILDRMMPSGDGINLIKFVKDISNSPVIMLTAMGENQNKIEGLKIGADDYLAKPFEPEELYLRVINLLNLYNTKLKGKQNIKFGGFEFDTTVLELKRNNNIIYLTESENDLLLKLINKRNEIVLREELAEQEFDESELRKIDVRITRLRQKIEQNPKQPQFIKTIRGKGYKLVCDV